MKRLFAIASLWCLSTFAGSVWAAANDVVQAVCDDGGGTSATVDGTDGWSTPTSGNRLLCFAANGNGSAGNYDITFPADCGSLIQEYQPNSSNGFHAQGALYSKDSADGDESSFGFTMNQSSSAGFSVCVVELPATGAFEDSAEDESDVIAGGGNTSTSSGTVTSVTSGAIHFGCLGTYNNSTWDASVSYTNSYGEQVHWDDAAGASSGTPPGIWCASKVLGAAGNYSYTTSTTDSGTSTYAASAVWAAAASDTDPPSYTSAPAVSTKTSTTVTIAATATDDNGPIDHYCSAYSDGSSTPSAANIKSGAGTGYVTSSNASDLNVTSGNAASVVVSNLTAETAYDIYCVAEDDLANLSASGSKVDVTTLAAVDGKPILVEDAFTDTNGTSITAHTLDTDEAGNGWAIEDVWTGQSAGTATIQSNQLELQEQTGAIIDVGTTAMVFDADYIAESDEVAEVILRWVDAANWWKCHAIPLTNTVRLQKRVADSTTNFGAQSYVFTAGQTYRVTGWANGNHLGCAIDGVPVVSVTDSALNTSTKGGVGADAGGATWDNVVTLQSFNAVNPNTSTTPDDPNGFFNGQTRQDGDIYWMDPDDLVDNSPETLELYYGGSFYIDPQTDFAGQTQWGIELYNSVTDSIATSSHTHTTVETSPGVAPVFNDVDCALKSNAYEVNVNPGPVDFSQCLTTIGQPSPSFSVSVGSVPTGRVFDTSGGVESGTPTTTTGSPFSYTITATNATGSDTLDVTTTVSAQAGSVPDCKQFPGYFVNLGDSIVFDVGDYCTGQSTVTFGTLASGLTGSAGVVSGVTDTAQFIETNVTISNSAGSVERVWRVEVWPAGTLCTENQKRREYSGALAPTALKQPFRSPIGSPTCRQF